jgi:mannose-6-phosphate isomerase-like protein (cupin superfamily)
MRPIHFLAASALGLLAMLPVMQAGAQDNKPVTAWAAKPAKLVAFKAPNKLIYRLADILAAHKGKQNWSQIVHVDRDCTAQWISMAPGEKTKTMFYADDRVYWEVQSGQMRVTIEGQEPFIAGKHFLVQVPERLQYSMETVGDQPVLRFQVTPTGGSPEYPLSETPTPIKGRKYVQATYSGRGKYDEVNKPYIDFEKQIVQGGDKTGVWIRDDHTYVTILRSPKGVPDPGPNSWGHFHENFPEFWLVIEGQQKMLVEGEKEFTIGDGDIMQAPIGSYHRALPAGDGPSTRLAFIPRPGNLHWMQPGQSGD